MEEPGFLLTIAVTLGFRPVHRQVLQDSAPTHGKTSMTPDVSPVLFHGPLLPHLHTILMMGALGGPPLTSYPLYIHLPWALDVPDGLRLNIHFISPEFP